MRNKFLETGDPGYHPLRKVRIILSGLKFGVIFEISVAYKLILSLIILCFSLFFHDWVDVMVILVSTAQVLTAELFNTSIEAVCDFVEPANNQKIMIIKDISAAATGISIAAWAIVIIYEYYKLVMLYVG
jgi:diacylglycerol kinase (ATP)